MKRILDSKIDKAKQESKKQKQKEKQQNTPGEKPASETRSNEGGSVIVDKVNESLEMLLKQWDARLKSDTPFPPKLQEYPDPLREKIDLIRNQQLIRDTQTTFEGPPAHIIRSPWMTKPELETIQEVADTEENASQGDSETKIEPKVPEELEQEVQAEIVPEIPALVEATADELWKDVRKLKEKEGVTETSAPLSIVGLTEYMGMDKMSLTDNQSKGEDDGNSEANTLATLPSFLGDYEAKTEVLQVPQSQQVTPGVKDTANLQAILSAPVTATLPLADFLKVKPKLWEYVAEMMRSQGFCLTKKMLEREQNKDDAGSVKQVPFNKVSSYQERNKDSREMLRFHWSTMGSKPWPS